MEGEILLNGDYFTEGVDIENVRVIYNGGYTTIPADLERAVIKLCAWDYLEAVRWNNTMVKGEKPVMEERKEIMKDILKKYKIAKV